MAWLRRAVVPVKRAWGAVTTRVKASKSGNGILELHEDVQMCGYQDVQVMWEMLKRSEMGDVPNPTKRRRTIWRVLLFSKSSCDVVVME